MTIEISKLSNKPLFTEKQYEEQYKIDLQDWIDLYCKDGDDIEMQEELEEELNEELRILEGVIHDNRNK